MQARAAFACQMLAQSLSSPEGRIIDTHNCSISGKKVCAPPLAIALANKRFPSALEKEITVSGSCLR